MKESAHKDKLVQDVKDVVAGAEALVKETAGDLSGKAKEIHAKLSDKVDEAKDKLKDLEGAVKEKAIASARDTDRLVRERPYESIGVAFVAGLLIGVLINHK